MVKMPEMFQKGESSGLEGPAVERQAAGWSPFPYLELHKLGSILVGVMTWKRPHAT